MTEVNAPETESKTEVKKMKPNNGDVYLAASLRRSTCTADIGSDGTALYRILGIDQNSRGNLALIEDDVLIYVSGNATIFEMQELSPAVADAMIKLTGEVSGLLSEADLLGVAEDLAPNSTAAALLVEHVWATRFSHAVRAAKGELVLSERIPGDVIDVVRATLIAAAAE